MARSISMNTAPPITNTDGTRRSSRIPAIKLKQAEKEASSRQAELQLSKASQAKIAKTKARKQLLDQVISFREKLADPALESEFGNLLTQFLRHESDEGLKTAINKIDFTTSVSRRISTHKRSHEATDLNVTDSVKPSKKARINKEHVSGTSDGVIAAPRSRPQTNASKSTRSLKVTTSKTVKRKSDDTDGLPPSKKRVTAKPSNAKKVTKPKAKHTTRSKETIAEASRKRSEGASYSSGEDQAEAHSDVNVGATAAATTDSTVDVNADAITDANAQGELEIFDQVPSPAKADIQGEVQAVEAEDEASASVIAQSSAQSPSQSPDETALDILQHGARITYFISLGIVMRRPGAGYGDTLDLSDSLIRSIMDRQLSEPANALDDRIMALLMVPHNNDCEADNWTIDFEECSYAYESAGDVNGGFVRDEKTTVEPFEYKSYYSMTNYWNDLRKIGIGLWDDNNGLYGCCGVNHSNNVITILGRHHAGDESESGLEKRLNRLFHFIQTHPDVADYDIDPLDGRRIQYGIFVYKYSMANDPAYVPSAAFAGDDDEDNYD